MTMTKDQRRIEREFFQAFDGIIEAVADHDDEIAIAAIAYAAVSVILEMSDDHNEALDTLQKFTAFVVDDIDAHFT